MKKIYGISLIALMTSVNAFAEYGIPTEKIYNFDRSNVASVLEEYITDSAKAQAAADKYNELSDNGENTISAVDFVDVCVIGGLKINASDGSGYTKCLEMFMKLIEMQNMDAGDFNLYCPATGNALKSITDNTQVGDPCGGTSDTYIQYGHVTVKAVDSDSNRTVSLWKVKNNKAGSHKYVCTCTPQSCKEGYYWNKDRYQCSVKDKEGYCARHTLTGLFNYGSGINTISKYDSEWSKTQKLHYNDKFAELDAQEDAFNKCVKYGTDNGCRVRGALAVASGTTKKYQVICNPTDAELRNHKAQQEEKDRQYKEEVLRHKKGNIKYYEVCGKDGGKTGGTERCENIFKDIEVQVAQAKNLAVEYAKVKYNDDIQCDLNVRTTKGVVVAPTPVVPAVAVVPVQGDDYMKCTSLKSNTFYEFQFDDAKESNAAAGKYIQMEFGRGLCLVYGGEPNRNMGKVASTVLENRVDFTSQCKISSGCSALNSKLSKWSYTAVAGDGGKCVVKYGEPTSKTGTSDDYYAKFDGYSFKIFHRGSVVKSWDAVSGRGKKPNDNRRTVCQTGKYQACEDIGPTPEGTWYISQNEIQYADNITMGNYTSNKPQALYWEKLPSKVRNKISSKNDLSAYGAMRVLLHPDAATQTYDRDHLYVHGGKYKGSAGCIDLTNKISDFIDWFATQTDFSTLKVVVDYGGTNEICGQKCTGPKCSLCECKKEINKDTQETNCDYI